MIATAAVRDLGSHASSKRPSVGEWRLRLLSRPDWVEPTVAVLKSKAIADGVCSEDTADRLVIALCEAITNAIVHGNFGLSSSLKEEANAFGDALAGRTNDPNYVGRVVDIRVNRSADGCDWTIGDEGAGFDVEALLRRLESDEPEDMLSSGRGVAIMKAFVDDVSWTDGGRVVRLSVGKLRGIDRRGAGRLRYVAPIRYTTVAGISQSAIARDLSATGIAFVGTESLALGTPLILTLDLDGGVKRDLLGVIVRCDDLSAGYHDVAVRFDRPIDPADFMRE